MEIVPAVLSSLASGSLASLSLLGGQAAAPAPPPAVSRSRRLRRSSSTPRSSAGRASSTGVTDTIRATLSDGRIHARRPDPDRGHPQTMFQAGKASEVNFKDTYRFNIAAYRLARLLGLQQRADVGGASGRRQTGRDDLVGRRRAVRRERPAEREEHSRPGSGAHVEADARHARLRRADSEPRSQPGQHRVDQGLDALDDRPHPRLPHWGRICSSRIS